MERDYEKERSKRNKVTLEEAPYIIPKDFEEKKEIAKDLEYIFLNYINKTGKEPIDAIVELCENKDIRVDDIEDYFPYMETIKLLIQPEVCEDSFKGLF